jgi:hypothetical protein
LIRPLLAVLLFASAPAAKAPVEVVSNPYGDMGIHFMDTATQVQRVRLGNAHKVVIECFCPVREVTYFGARDELTLRITGAYSISGYHGSREDAGAVSIPRGALHLVRREEGAVLRLLSREYHYIHHTLKLPKVRVRAPEGVEVVFEPVSEEQLDGRDVR